MAQAWFRYPIDKPGSSYGQITDPLGPYKKPDVNIAVPSGVPITSLTSGIVTDVSDHGASSGGLSVVVRMSSPLNRLATHVAYNYLGSSSVRVGQSVSIGMQLGVAGSRYGMLTAVGLTPDNTWGNGSFYLNAQGNGLLDPHQILTGVPGGVSLSNSPGSTSAVFGPAFMSVSTAAHDLMNNIPGFEGICYGLDAIEEFVPYKLVSTGGQEIGILGKIPIVGGIATGAANIATLPSDSIQALLVFITSNVMAALVRLFIIVVGLIIIIALVYNAIEYSKQYQSEQTASTVSNLAKLAVAP